MSVYGIYVELDCLLDTRLATVSLLHDPTARELIVSDVYYHRRQDDWLSLSQGHITQDTFNHRYTQRDTTTLKRARLTELHRYLSDLVAELEPGFALGGEYERCVVEVNLWPYRLSEAEKQMVVTATMAVVGSHTEVKTVWLSPELLTLKQIKQRWLEMFMYDFDGWCKAQGNKGLVSDASPQTSLYTPRLLRPGEEDNFKAEHLPTSDPFQVLENAFLPCLRLVFLDSWVFSLYRLGGKNASP